MYLPRRFYVTPKSFLGMLALFSSMLGEQHSQLTTSRERLLNGLNKLQETNAVVDGMQKELTALQPTLQLKTASAEQLLAQVSNRLPVNGLFPWHFVGLIGFPHLPHYLSLQAEQSETL